MCVLKALNIFRKDTIAMDYFTLTEFQTYLHEFDIYDQSKEKYFLERILQFNVEAINQRMITRLSRTILDDHREYKTYRIKLNQQETLTMSICFNRKPVNSRLLPVEHQILKNA